MFYYRYRQGNELSIKELMYDEMFFASPVECNDPCEGTFLATFDKNPNYWEKFIEISVGQKIAEINRPLVKKLTNYFFAKSPMSSSEFLSINFEDIAKSIGEENNINVLFLLAQIINKFKIYSPSEHYFVSFSRSNDNFLMWSHYANKHQGYCLVFRPVDNKICQNPKIIKTGVEHVTPNAFSSKMTFSIPREFDIKPIEYVSEPINLNAFMCLPEYVCANDYTEEEKNNFRENFYKIYLNKNSIWSYEEESRIIINGGIQRLAEQETKLLPQQRLLHYDPTQLVGIIFGARMSQERRDLIRYIITEKVRNWFANDFKTEKILSDFVILEEKISNNRITVEPIEIISGHSIIDKSDTKFQNTYEDWINGHSIRLLNGSGEHLTIT